MNASLPPSSIADRAEFTIGRILLDEGKLSAQDAERVLRLHKEKKLLFGAAATQLGLVTEADVQQALARQFDYPYLAAGEGGYARELIAAYEPFDPQVEALRALRSQLMLRWFGLGKRMLAIVSADPEDGAGTLAANLAIVFSQLGERTLLIDANLRADGASRLFNRAGGMGLSDLLAERAGLDVVGRVREFVDLSLLPAGTRPPNPAELLSRARLAQVLEDLAGSHDVILLDTPAASLGGDFQIAAARAGGALLVARRHRSRVRELAGIKAMITAAGASVVGAVVSGR